MSQVTLEKSSSTQSAETDEMTDERLKAAQDAGKTALEDVNVDDILAEIDNVLEENAVEFVENFMQRGGE